MRCGVVLSCVEFMEHNCCHYKTSLNTTIDIFGIKYTNDDHFYTNITLLCWSFNILIIINNWFKCIPIFRYNGLNSTTNSMNAFSNLGFILFSVIFVFMPQIINSKPLVKPSIGPIVGPIVTSDSFSYAMEFLVKFGYLPKSESFDGNLRSESQLKSAISTMQKFAHLPPTGIIDNTTLALMKKKRCGVPDLFPVSHNRVKRYALQGSKWNKTQLTWSVRDWSREIDPNYVRKELRRAFKVWSDVSRLTFTEVRSADADIVISFLRGRHGDEYPFDGPGSILGHAFFPGDDIGGDAHFDADEQWSQKRSYQIPEDNDNKNNWEGVSLFGVAVHEFGHSLGLAHSSVRGSLMFPYYQRITDDFKLPNDDVVGIQQLYGSNGSTKWAPMPALPTPKYPERPLTKPPLISPPVRPKPTNKPLSPTTNQFPDGCNTNIDAIASIRQNIFIFKGKYFWWFNSNRTLLFSAYKISLYWNDFPENLEKVDAVYERQSDSKIVFFIGKEYWLFNNNKLERGYPRPITDFGLPSDLNKIDAAMIWGHNGKTYLFSGSKYWRFEEQENRVELDYPRDVSVWTGIPHDIDAAFQWSIDGQTYFFKGRKFWKFDNRMMKVSEGYPQSISQFWFESLLCKIETESTESTDSTDSIDSTDSSNTPSINSINSVHINNFHINIIFINALLFYNFYILKILNFNVLFYRK